MPTPAAQYVRMSTEHQQYSILNQTAAINLYAIQRGFDIVQTYRDEGRTGLVLRERAGLKQLLADVMSGQSPYRAILVYDVSRWGRFQDIDEAAHYEFMCKSMGVPVHYCAESFGTENGMVNAIMKSLKRTMASEYSRELSEKVSAGARRLVSLGYRQGGMAGYGLRRLLVTAGGTPKQILGEGERKSISTDRVILTHGPAEEVECVREIYRLVIEERRTPTYIASELNRRHVPFMNGSPWYQEAVTRILTHPKYKGCVVYGQRMQKLHQRSTSVPKERWLVAPGRHQGIVSPETFQEAQRILGQRTHYMTNEELLEGVRQLWAKHGKLRLRMIDESPDLPSNRVYVERFGSFWNVCKLIGYEGKGRTFLRTRSRLLHQDIRRDLMEHIVAQNGGEVRIEKCGRKKDRLRLRSGRSVAVVLGRCIPSVTGKLRWAVSRSPYEDRRVALMVLLNAQNNLIHSTYLSTCIIRLDSVIWEKNFDELNMIKVNEVTDFVSQVQRLLSR